MSDLRGKGIFLWKVPLIEGGDPERIANLLHSAGISRVDVKVAEGPDVYRVPRWNHLAWGENVKPAWVAAMQERDIEVWGYGFVYGNDPAGEGRIGAEQANRLNLDGYLIDAESAFERQANAVSRARSLTSALRNEAPTLPVALVSWPLFRNPWTGSTWHNDQVAAAFMERLNYQMPMCYWWNNNALLWLEKSVEQYQQMVSDKPIIPAGRAYSGEGLGTINPTEMIAFGQRVRELELPGESWWAAHTATADEGVWSAISNLPPFPSDGDEPPPDDPLVTVELRRSTLDAIRAEFCEL